MILFHGLDYFFQNMNESLRVGIAGAGAFLTDVYLGVNIKECCYLHDESCITKQFFNALKSKFEENNIKLAWFHAGYITIGGAVGCWLKYTSKMFKRI